MKNMHKIKAFIFDLDGVIVDTAKYHFLAWKYIAEKLGFEFTENDNERLKGVSRMRSLDILLEVGNLTLEQSKKGKLAEEKNNLYLEHIYKLKKDEILPGVLEFLIQAKKLGIKVALGSASKNAPLILDQLGLTSMFDALIDGNSVSKAKPDPEVFLKGAETLKVTPESCVVFEDAEAGIEAAIAGNMLCVGVGSELNLGKANVVISGFQNLSPQNLLEKLGGIVV